MSRGFSLLEMLVVVSVLSMTVAMAVPALKAWQVEGSLVGAGQAFRTEFRKARSMAVKQGVYTAIRFERGPEGDFYSVYADGNGNGVRSVDIRRGVDYRVAGPLPLTAGLPGVRVGINPGVPNIPPERGTLGGDPIRFGASSMLSFSPLGTASPGTFYLAGEHLQGAVRVTPGSARVRLMVCRGRAWRER
jgi:prepilin-type N-terminal cleavage/methylation domain-containing protein